MTAMANLARALVRRRAAWFVAGLIATGCVGKIQNSPPGGSSSTSGGPGPGSTGNGVGGRASGASQGTGSASGSGGQTGPCDGLTARRVRRLSRREYANVISDLLGAKAQQEALAMWPDEPTVGGFDNQSEALFVSPSLQEDVADLATQLAGEVDVTSLAPCATAGGSNACLQAFIRSFAGKAYGRPLKDAEVAAASTMAATGQDYATSVKLVVEMVLQSPHTLYVTELGPEDAPAGQVVSLTPDELASQLSFLLAGTRPDATLSAAAQSTGFKNSSDIQQQAQRLLSMPSGQAQLARFITGWLDMGTMDQISKAPDVYPEFTPAVVTAMQQEFDQFVAAQLNGGNGTLAGFMTATSANVPAALSVIYGSDLQTSGLDPRHRRGVLSLPALLASHSSDVSSGPVQRGLLVRRQLLCQYVPPPPPSVLDQITKMPVDTADTSKTTRQKFEDHLNMPSCAACHASFDPIGFGMEDMDGIGRFRTTENGLPVDSTGSLTNTDVDGPFEGPAALSLKLAQSAQLATCMVNHFFSFAQARDAEDADQCVIQEWSAKFAQGGGRINDLVNTYVVHRNFVYRKDDR